MSCKSKMCLEHLPAFKAWLANQPEFQVSDSGNFPELFRVRTSQDRIPRTFFQEKSSIVGYGPSIQKHMASYLRDHGSALVNGKERHYSCL